ncbi:MAG: NADPH-dependent F420 reductase [bacterium]
MEKKIQTIGILGGSGALGSALSYRLGKAGYQVIIGSRNQGKASEKVNEINQRLKQEKISIESNYLAAEKSDLVILAVPFSNLRVIVEEIVPVVQKKIVLETTVPLVPPKVARVQLPEYGSVAKKTQELFGKEVRVVSAFQNVAASHLNGDDSLPAEILVFGINKDARETIIGLIQEIGMKGWHAGSIDNSVVAESMTSVLIFMNKFYNMEAAGINIVDSSLNH